jgi:hypothetical protein
MLDNRRSSDSVLFNGISGVDSRYPFPRTTVADIAALGRGEQLDKSFLDRLQRWIREIVGLFRETRDGFSETHLAEAGWAVIFSRNADPKVREALRPLLDWREKEAASLKEGRYRELWGENGYRKGESVRDFLLRHGVEPGAADPRRLPYYILLVGSPAEIPFSFQYDLDVRYAVGRLDLDEPREYAVYAESVVAAERAWNGPLPAAERRMALFCPSNSDMASLRLREELVDGLISRLSKAPQPGWSMQSLLDDYATREGLCALLEGDRTPDLLFTGCHGLAFPSGHPLQREKQGALYCQDGGGTTPLETSVSAAEISDHARVHGLIAFHFACYSAGTPELDVFTRERRLREADRPFTARLPQRLLGHPNGSALAVIGHVSRAWTYSFSGFGNAPHINTFEDVLRRLLVGETVGRSLELFNFRYAQLAAELLNLQDQEEWEEADGKRDADLAILYCSARDARNYVVLGDPAVRLQSLPVSPQTTAEAQAHAQI